MAVRKILEFPHPRLAESCLLVTEFDDALGRLLDDMRDTMVDGHGIGLAANQIGEEARAIVMMSITDDGHLGEPLELVNPRLTRGTGHVSAQEGCLSFPGAYEWIPRANTVTVAYQDRTGAPQEMTCQATMAVCLQHEVDHLDGHTFVSRMSSFKRKFFLREYTRARAKHAQMYRAIEELKRIAAEQQQIRDAKAAIETREAEAAAAKQQTLAEFREAVAAAEEAGEPFIAATSLDPAVTGAAPKKPRAKKAP